MDEKRNKLGNLVKGWDAKNKTYDQVYAKKYGKKIFVNTGIIAISDADRIKADKIRYVDIQQGWMPMKEFEQKVADFIKRGVEIKVLKERSTTYGTVHRIMVRKV